MRVFELMAELVAMPAGAEIAIMCTNEVKLAGRRLSVEKIEDDPADPMVCMLTLGCKE